MTIYYNISELYSIARMILELDYKVICLRGEVGSGKTTFSKAFLKFLSSDNLVTSPSFSLINSYESASGSIIAYHIDLYRVKSKEEVIDLDLDYYFDSDVFVLVEWPDIAEYMLPIPRLELHFEHISENERKVNLTEFPKHRLD